MTADSPQKFLDSLIISIGSLYIAIISFVLIYSYVSVNLYQYNQTLPKLIALDRLLALRHLTTEVSAPTREAKLNDLPTFFLDAIAEKSDELSKELLRELPEEGENDSNQKENDVGRTKENKPLSRFMGQILPNSKVLLNLPMRMGIDGTCNVLLTNLLPGGEFNFAAFTAIAGSYAIKSENVQLAAFSCITEFKVLLFKLNDDRVVLAVPRTLEEVFKDQSRSPNFFSFSFQQVTEVTNWLPDPLRVYVQFTESYIFWHEKKVDYLVLDYVRSQLGKHFPANRLYDAAQQLYEREERNASYLGITAPLSFLVRMGPLIYFLLSFELWRRVRRLPSGKFTSAKYWFAFETADAIGRVYSLLYAIAPLLFGILIYSLFAISQALGLVVFGHLLTLPGLLALSFHPATWLDTDYLALTIACVVAPIHFVILFLTAKKLIHVVLANRRS